MFKPIRQAIKNGLNINLICIFKILTLNNFFVYLICEFPFRNTYNYLNRISKKRVIDISKKDCLKKKDYSLATSKKVKLGIS